MTTFKPNTYHSNHLLRLHRLLLCPNSPPFSPPTSRALGFPRNPRFCSLSHSPRFSSSCSSSLTFMEIVKATVRRGSAEHERIALRIGQKSYSYAQLISSAWRLSNLLCGGDGDFNGMHDGKTNESSSSLKCSRGTRHLDGARIGIVAKPSAEFVAGMLGTWLSGGVAVPLALSYPEAELFHVMIDSDVSVLLSSEEHQDLMENVAAKCASQFSLIPLVPSIPLSTNLHDQSNTGNVDVVTLFKEIENSKMAEGDDDALIVYTSGTTGKPKGVVHTHESIKAQVQILTEAWEYTSADQFLHCLPLHHVHGLFNALLAPLYAGSLVEFMPKFSVRGIWQRWRESYPQDGSKVDDAITVFTGVPTMYTRLLQGYEAMDPELQAASASAAHQLRLMVKIIAEDESGNETAVGELCIKSPSLFKEYRKRPEVTKASFVDGGFFKTGDTVRVDEDGYYIILGRTSADIMKVGGYKLSALEIEAVLLEHPAVSECCVLGLPDKDYGESVSVVIVPSEDAKRRGEDLKPAISLEELRTWAKEKLAPYKIPTRLFLWDMIPRNAMGKVNKKEVKKMLE